MHAKTKMKIDPKELAAKFYSACRKLGWTVQAGAVVTIQKNFAKGDKQAYSECDGEAFDLLGMIPLKGGSVWGTDGGSVGGYVGMAGGYYRLNKSFNGGARFMSALERILLDAATEQNKEERKQWDAEQKSARA